MKISDFPGNGLSWFWDKSNSHYRICRTRREDCGFQVVLIIRAAHGKFSWWLCIASASFSRYCSSFFSALQISPLLLIL